MPTTDHCSSTDVEVCSYDLEGKNQLDSQPLEANDVHQFTAIPGLLFLHTNKGITLLHPGTLEPVMIHAEDSTSRAATEDSIPYQFKVEDAHFSVVKVWDVEGCESGKDGLTHTLPTEGDTKEADLTSSEARQQPPFQEVHNSNKVSPSAHSSVEEATKSPLALERGKEAVDVGIQNSGSISHKVASSAEDHGGFRTNSDQLEFGSCLAAFSVNNRLLVIKTAPRWVKS